MPRKFTSREHRDLAVGGHSQIGSTIGCLFQPFHSAALKFTAPELLKLGVIDGVLNEQPGGAHRDVGAMARVIAETLRLVLPELDSMTPEERARRRQDRFIEMGAFLEAKQERE